MRAWSAGGSRERRGFRLPGEEVNFDGIDSKGETERGKGGKGTYVETSFQCTMCGSEEGLLDAFDVF